MKSKRVLIVDDNDLNRKLFENLIGQLWTFESAHNGLEAIEMASTGKFDLILMDIQMPQLDGISAMKKIREKEFKPCPIIAVTAFADESDRQTFLEEGFDGFVTKPIRPRGFLELLRGHLEGNDTTRKSEEKPQEEEIAEVILDKKVLNQLMKYNNPLAIKKIFLDFNLEATELCNKAILAAKNEDLELVRTSIHTIKGNSGTLGINRVYLKAQKVELLARSGEKDRLKKSLEELQFEIQSFNQFIKEEAIFES
ncbi:hybrid sensor histidine kinase/response regulator [Algoriphagus sp. CAU 1675]|uniref:response regulator n=1 Tax=Algoriphagus sp. CAU 1675 TaxID=3032597 RepID=UPI0023DA5315|nr:hybrid sensor histidine kinase/response regulator [Algoriphagus sp. CAU 1675]MDF2158147.1 response regulator [Algoriphagus sp. CAU 1675]